MRARAGEIVALVVCLAVVAAIGVARDARARAQDSTYSSYDTGRNGYRALFEVLQREGASVRRFERPIGLLDEDVATLVISDNGQRGPRAMPARRPAPEILELRAFVTRGGRLVVLQPDLGDGDDALLGLPRSSKAQSRPSATRARQNALTAGVAVVRGTFATAFARDARVAGTQRPITPLLRTPEGFAAVAYPLGKGEVVAVVAPDAFSNANLAYVQNARFAYNVLAAGGGPIAFDERVHGYAQDRTLWEALPPPVRYAFWIALAAVALALVESNVRFAPAIPIEPPDERDSAAYVVSMAALLRRARASRAAVRRFGDDALRRVRRRYGSSRDDASGTLAARIDRDDVRGAMAELDRLQRVERPSDPDLVRAAQLNSRLRKDLA